MQNQSRPQNNNSNKGNIMNAQEGKETSSATSSATKSVGAVIGESLAKDTQERIDEVMERVNGYFKSAKEYVTENPKETAAIVAAIGIAAWVLLYTKPGRKVFEKGASGYIPQISNWITQNLTTSSSVTKH